MDSTSRKSPTVCNVIIKDCSVLLEDQSIKENQSIIINDGKITTILDSADAKNNYSPEHVISGAGKLAIPGLIDGHTHMAQQLLRGGVVDEPPIVWQRILIPFENGLTEEDLYWGAMVGCVQMAKSGITCFADSGTGEMEPIIEAALLTGMRGNFARMSRDGGSFIPSRFKDTAAVVVKKTEDLFKAYHGKGDGRIHIAFSATSLQTTSPEFLEMVALAAQEYQTVFHIHLAEHLKEVQQCLTEFGLRPVEYLEKYGALQPNLLGAHAVQLSDREICMLAEHDAKLIHCPASNLHSHGFPKTPTMLTLGIKVGLGTDGAASTDLDLFGMMRILKYAIQARFGLPIFDPHVLTTDQLFKMPTLNSAAALQISDDVGSLRVGKKADIVLLKWDEIPFTPAQKKFPMLVMVAGPRDVNDVVIDGQIIVKDRVHQLVDEQEVMAKAAERMRIILSRS